MYPIDNARHHNKTTEVATKFVLYSWFDQNTFRGLVKLKKFKKSEKNSDCPDYKQTNPPIHFFNFLMETCTTTKTTQNTQYLKKTKIRVGACPTHPLPSFSRIFWIFLTWQNPLAWWDSCQYIFIFIFILIFILEFCNYSKPFLKVGCKPVYMDVQVKSIYLHNIDVNIFDLHVLCINRSTPGPDYRHFFIILMTTSYISFQTS